MIGFLTVVSQRGLGLLARMSMYRLVLLSLAVLAVCALIASLFGAVAPGPLELVATAAVLVVACGVVDAVVQRILGRAWRAESSLITAGILLFVLQPGLDPATLGALAFAGAVASLSKYVLAWGGRHVFNPAAVGAAVLTISALGAAAWWVATPVLFVPVLVLGLLIAWRTERARVIWAFVGIAVVVAIVRALVQLGAAGIAPQIDQLLSLALLQSPVLFLGVFMFSEPLTMPPQRWQQFIVAAVAGVLAGWPVDVGWFTLGQERALLIGNLVAFAFAARRSVRLSFTGRRELTPTVRELSFRVRRPVRFRPGQYMELEVPHRHPDARGTRREFSIASAPDDMPELRIAFREDARKKPSSFKRALAAVQPGDRLAVTGVWGDFLLPRDPRTPVLLVAAGIGVTPFVSQLRHARLAGEDRDIVLVYVVSRAEELAYRDELEACGVPVIVVTASDPGPLAERWSWNGGARLDAEELHRVVGDLERRHAYVSGPPALIADLAPALERARSLTTDAFAGY